MHAGDEVGINDAVRVALHDGLLVGQVGVSLIGGDERRADIAQIRPHRLRRQHRRPGGEGARQRDGAVEPHPDFLHQRERRQGAGVPPRAGREGDQPIGALLDGLPGKAVVDDVVQHGAAVGMDGLVHLRPGAERGDDDRHPVARAHLHVVLQPDIAAMDDLVHRERRRRAVRVVGVPVGQGVLDLHDPVGQRLRRAGVERGEGADDPRGALGDHQRRVGDDEQRRGDHRQGEPSAEQGGEGWGESHAGFRSGRLRREPGG